MIGCKYCRMMENGDFGEDLTSLLAMEQCWKPVHEIESVNPYGLHKPKEVITTQLMEVTIFGNKLNICFNGIFEFKRYINFCPICGRELKNETD